MPEIINKRSDLDNPTPMMKQYLEVKEDYADFILMYRLGDFYECFFEDALIASKELGLTLTSRDCGSGRRAAMCGVPFHKSDAYVAQLINKSIKVAICEQVEDPKDAVGLVRREVTRVVTPGTVTDTDVLNSSTNNYLASVCFGVSGIALGFADVSTGDMHCTYIDGEDIISRVHNELGVYQPSEAVINVSREECLEIASFLDDKCGTLVNYNEKRLFSFNSARDNVKTAFGDKLEELNESELVMAVGALVSYIRETQKTEATFANELTVYSRGQYLELDYNTRRNLEITELMRSKDKRGSLLWVLDKTKTAMGARLLRSWVVKPLINPVTINIRQSIVAELVANPIISEEICELLAGTLDIERLTARAVYGSANAKDLRAIYTSIKNLPDIKNLVMNSACDRLKELCSSLDTLDDVSDLLERSINENPPFTIREGGMIRSGFNSDVDYYRGVKENGSGIMKEIEAREREETGIRTLKVDYNKVFGYYIEVSKSFIEDVPPRFVRKQTLTNCERYITQELKEMESAIFSADEKLVTLEYDLFCAIRGFVADNSERIRDTAALIASIDVYRSLAEVARKYGYVRPEVDMSYDLSIKDGRHPVVERFATESYFVPNDTTLDVNANRVMIITGPNMAGKSTYMRQVAIIAIMAQIGSFVPAREAHIGIVDKIFTRVGASDDLASGQSTFMLEMSEVAFILKNATKRSLIIYDEVGRGTSTFDGMAIARSVVEYTHSKKIGAKTLFATHYHELTDMEEQFDGIVNYNIAAKKRGDSVIFLRKIVRGGTDDSYGIEVAKLAGVPSDVVKRAREILKSIEGGEYVSSPSRAKTKDEPDLFSGIIASKDSEVAEKIRNADINTMTPIEAMNMLFELKRMLNG